MKEVVRIAPVQNDPGLIAYECPSCGYVTSVLIGPQSGDQGKDRPADRRTGKFKNPDVPAVKREAEEDWNGRRK
jgi:hypothetical protein